MTAHLLIIEDNPTNMQLAEYLLRCAGYAPAKAYDRAAGLQLIEAQRPDLVICDLQMPVLDGYEVLQRVRSTPATQDLVVVAVTALSMPGDKARVLAAGFNGYLSKPIDPETFVAELEVYLPPELRARRSTR